MQHSLLDGKSRITTSLTLMRTSHEKLNAGLIAYLYVDVEMGAGMANPCDHSILILLKVPKLSCRKLAQWLALSFKHNAGMHSVTRINSLFIKVPSINKKIRLTLRGKSLLLIGKNGCGKTSFMSELYEELKKYTSHRITQNLSIKKNISDHLEYIDTYPDQASQYKKSIANMRRNYHSNQSSLIRFIDAEKLNEIVSKKHGALVFFPAYRKAEIKKVESASSVIFKEQTFYDQREYSKELEQHLVNLKVKMALETINGNPKPLSDRIDLWLKDFEDNIKYLLEDDSAVLLFNSESLRYEIKQTGRPSYLLQDLSSGYSSIIDIYANLAMRLRRYDMTPRDLQGIVLIDEIDAHLHVSLQRKVLPFLIKSFPSVQFIVSTHSPFVVSSVDDVVIYDVSNNRTAIDLSMYSVDSIIEGLLGVPVISKKLEDELVKLRLLTDSNTFNHTEIERIISKISPYLDSLDEESRLHYEIARKKLLTKTKAQ